MLDEYVLYDKMVNCIDMTAEQVHELMNVVLKQQKQILYLSECVEELQELYMR